MVDDPVVGRDRRGRQVLRERPVGLLEPVAVDPSLEEFAQAGVVRPVQPPLPGLVDREERTGC